jgi:hypothetical protein
MLSQASASETLAKFPTLETELTLFSYFKTENPAGPSMVRIYFGPQRTLWVLPEDLICDRVKFFKAAFQSDFRESKEKVLELPEDDPVAFAYVLDGILGDVPGMQGRVPDGDDDAIQLALCNAYILADKLGREDIMTWACDIYEYRSPPVESSWGVPVVSPPAAKLVYEKKPWKGQGCGQFSVIWLCVGTRK